MVIGIASYRHRHRIVIVNASSSHRHRHVVAAMRAACCIVIVTASSSHRIVIRIWAAVFLATNATFTFVCAHGSYISCLRRGPRRHLARRGVLALSATRVLKGQQ
jgi:hypothetical protein